MRPYPLSLGFMPSVSSGEERYTFIADSYVHQGSYWTFVQKLEEPLSSQVPYASLSPLIGLHAFGQ